MLVHICCSVDSHFFLEKLKIEYPNEKLVGYFYDPNIHPYSEYRLRYYDVKFSCKKLGIDLIEGAYNLESWLEKVKGLEDEPEKGERCKVCFDDRLSQSVEKAIELGHDKFTTTLLVSPKKSQDRLDEIGKNLSTKSGLEWIFKDYRTGNGTQLQNISVKENNLYRQNYCGCLFGLTKQRDSQDKLMDEMFSPISNQILPESIEERLELYKLRDELESQSKSYKIIKQRFLNYRNLSAKVIQNKKVISSYFLYYSTIANGRCNGRIELEIDNIFYLNRNEVKFISLEHFNNKLKTNYKDTKELIFNPPKIKDEINLRKDIIGEEFDLSSIIVLDKVDINAKYEIEIDYKIYEDVKEVIKF